jgi:hypothetical protein
MSPKRRLAFWIEEEQAAGLKAIKERDGIPEAEQIRRAIAAWLDSATPSNKADRKRAVTRKRP